MKKVLLLLILLTQIQYCWAQSAGEQKYYVINISGAKLYEQPSFQSKPIKVIEKAESLPAVTIIETNETQKIEPGFSLTGNWIKTQHGQLTGYVFSADLSMFEPALEQRYGNTRIINLLGDTIATRTEIRIEKYGSEEFEREYEITEYTNGTYTYSAFDGCFDHCVTFKNLILSEVYHHMANSYANFNDKGESFTPTFDARAGNEYLFHSIGATQDLKIVEKENGEFVVSSYDCT